MNATSLPGKEHKERDFIQSISMKDNLNHFLLNKLLVLRYHVRKKPVFIKALIVFESTLVKIHLIGN